jgi:hypothetical protein
MSTQNTHNNDDDGDAQPISYPSLVVVANAAAAIAKATAPPPPPPPTQLTCSACGATFTGIGTQTTLTCQHKVHGDCYLRLAQKFSTTLLGGKRHCKHCAVVVIGTTGADGSSSSSRLTREACLAEARAAYIAAFQTDLEALCDDDDAPVTDAEMLVLLGPLEADEESVKDVVLKRLGWVPPAPATEAAAAAVAASSKKREKTLEQERARLLALRGDELIDELVLHRKRTLNVLLETWRVNVAHLWRVGVRSMEQLVRLGFSVSVHTNHAYRRVLPLYFLVERCDLDYDTHLNTEALTNEQLLDMRLTKQEWRLLGVTAAMLLDERHFTSRDLLAMKIRPSSLHTYLELSEQQLLTVAHPPLTADDFRENTQWNNDRRESEFSKRVFEAIKARDAAVLREQKQQKQQQKHPQKSSK